MPRTRLLARKRLLTDREDDDVLRRSPEERLLMGWQLTVQAWAFRTGAWDEPRLQRDAGRVIRGRR